MTVSTVIKTDGLTKRFPRVTALDRLTVEVEPGVVGLVGANGAGKSTLIKILLGLSPATEGTGQVLGLDIATQGPAIRERVGYMPEHDCLPPDVSATEFVVHMARMSGLPAAAARERTADTLRHVGLYEERYRPMGGYSTGMKQRVKLAQALVHDPQLVLLDEPTNGLDPVGRDEMLGLIRRIHSDFGISVLVTTHLLGELERTCDHLVVIDGGKLLRSSSTASFTGSTQLLAVEVTDHPSDRTFDADAVLTERLTAAGLTVRADGSRILLVEITGDETYDTVRDTVDDLGLGLIRLEQRRHRVAEIFSTRSDEDEHGEYDEHGEHGGPGHGQEHGAAAYQAAAAGGEQA
ncbi:ABC transporter ATP-binding protein [Kitasatospora sp. YST-16]|uniref:ABC transporter ATP-binding protein n=1 Tax=Kitasatospora sp. YST-16 TaxID=2998080 RepID=UPI0022835191|nr:ABC transporter ATP-binding protein [Kitasatospora sp. YST-16]WAL73032.1 ABC transporter ATP-binding protein [Kitasatospora sp. YST-16]WNW39083.1 ABC transporter ATP-binding protein [Streptomyces sp. Li-HN-5-13]